MDRSSCPFKLRGHARPTAPHEACRASLAKVQFVEVGGFNQH